ncbi:MAG: type II toxin-antitoxin system HipA family toxin YjjJ [Dokdonella sp.]
MSDARYMRLEALLRLRGAQPAAAIAAELQVSQPTVSRMLTDAGARIVRIGRARASRYALAHEVGRAGSHWPLYRIDANGRPETLGELQALHGDGFYFESTGARPAFMHGDFASGLFPGLPWFLDDQRPQGFLGRAFANHVAGDIGAPTDIALWRADDIVLALLRHGDDQPGNLVLGEDSLQRALQAILTPSESVRIDQRGARYPELAEAALRGEGVGSSAGGEQPKFAITLLGVGGHVPVIVKFSDRLSTPGGRRWADLLICEYHAGEVLHEHHLPAARSELIEAGSRMFLQSTRFDRTSKLGRSGFVSLAALDSAFYGHGRIDWWRVAPQLQRDGWLDADDARRLRLFSWYGALIANSDMHLGNAALQLVDQRPLPLAPIYDMLPMRFRPANSGEIVERRYEITLPTPEHHDDWRAAARMAQDFWERVGSDTRMSAQFRGIAGDASTALQRALTHLSG